MNATIGGDVQVAFASIAPALPLVQAGKLRLLAVTSSSRSPAVPDTPTIGEAGVPGYDVTTWFGIAGPAGMAADVLQRLDSGVARAMQAPEMREALLKQGLEPAPSGHPAFTRFVHDELAKNAALVREIGLKAE
jgi:tripartite-type tricarboxylate transporter receptor subunit TctC